MVDEIQNGTSVNYTLHLLPTCFLEGAARIQAHGPDEEISDLTDFFRPNPPDSLANGIPLTQRGRRMKNLGVSLAQWDQDIVAQGSAILRPQSFVKKGDPKRPVVHHLFFHENHGEKRE